MALKIAQIVSTFPPYRGGMGNVAYHLSRGLISRGYQVSVFTPQRLVDDQEIPVRRLESKFTYGNAALVDNIDLVTEDQDILHFHHPFVGAESVLKSTKPLVMTYHMDLVGRGWKRALFNFYQATFLESFLKRADRVIFTSQDYLEHSLVAEHYSKYADKFRVIPLGVSDVWMPGEEVDWPRLGVKEARVIIFIGGLDKAHYFKGLEVLLNAYRKLSVSDTALVVIGDGELKDTYREQAPAGVYFLGNLETDELIKACRSSEFLVLPSVDSSEAFSLVILEAYACAKPVIASNLPGVRTLVSPETGLLVTPGSETDLAEKISSMLSRQDLKKMGEAGLNIVNQKYRWPRVIDELEKVYQELL